MVSAELCEANATDAAHRHVMLTFLITVWYCAFFWSGRVVSTMPPT